MTGGASGIGRALALALAALFLVASIGLAGWHRATVMHGTCAEHGEALHFQKVAQAPAEADHEASSISRSTFVPGEGDEHCEILAAAAAAVDAPVAAQHHVVLEAHAAPPALIAHVPQSSALYRVAPKTSPPVG